jgi:hypothetical protein
MLEAYEFLTKNQSQEICEKLHSLREHWTNRGGYFEYPFFSLGTASYMDAVANPDYYYENSKISNKIIEENFADLLKRIADFLQEKLGKATIYHPRMALPGFHIFLADELFEIPVASRHVDLQYQLLDWQDLKFDPKDSISFTVYVRMPSSGSGLYLWNYVYEDLKDLHEQARQDKLAGEEYEYKQFSEGQFVIHDGVHFHQIAAMKDIQDNDERISLQGHAILSGDTYYLYW